MYYRLKPFLKKRNIFNDSQYGYGVGEGPPVLALQWLDNKVVSMICTSTNANDKVQVTRKTRVAGVWDSHRRVAQL